MESDEAVGRGTTFAGASDSTSDATNLMTDGKEKSRTDYARSMAQGFTFGISVTATGRQ